MDDLRCDWITKYCDQEINNDLKRQGHVHAFIRKSELLPRNAEKEEWKQESLLIIWERAMKKTYDQIKENSKLESKSVKKTFLEKEKKAGFLHQRPRALERTEVRIKRGGQCM